MKLRQIELISKVVDNNFNLSKVAVKLFTSQPGISKSIIDLEKELQVSIFKRQGKRLIGLSEAGKDIYTNAQSILLEIDNIKKISDEYRVFPKNRHENSKEINGKLTIAATHTQARYSLPTAITRFQEEFPNIALSIKQGSPEQISQWVNLQMADVAIATEFIANDPNLVTLPIYQWQHLLIGVSKNEEFVKILQKEKIGLKDLANVPLITYEQNFAGRQKIDESFAKAGITPNIVLQAMDSDVIKTYVELGMGLGIVAEVAVNSNSTLTTRELGHLFGKRTTCLGVKKGAFQRQFVREFIKILCPKYSDNDLHIFS